MAYYRTINHDKQFIAFFSPKCGSTTVKEWFIASLELAEPIDHAQFGRYMIPVGEAEQWAGYRKIFFIRNPFHRLVSFYCGFVVPASPLWCFADDDGRRRLEGRTFSEMVKTLAELRAEGKPFQHHLQPQLQGVRDIEIDTIVRIEDFDREIGAFNQEFGIDYAPKRLNATRYQKGGSGNAYNLTPEEIKQRDTPEAGRFYNEELIDIVADLFREDIKYYERHTSNLPQEGE